MNEPSSKTPATLKDLPYREVILRLEKPFPPSGTTLTARQNQQLQHILRVMVLVGNLADEVKRNIFYEQDNRMSAPKMRTLVEETMKALARLNEPVPTADNGNWKVTRQQIRLIHATLGLITEPAEIADRTLNHVFDQADLDNVNLREEAGDVRWYYELLCAILGTTDEEVCKINTNKLDVRYRGKFSTTAAVNRDLEAEKKELE